MMGMMNSPMPVINIFMLSFRIMFHALDDGDLCSLLRARVLLLQ